VYAVIKVAGKQFRVAEGDTILLDQPEDQDVTTEVLMLVDGSKVLTGADAAKFTVTTSKHGIKREKTSRAMKFKPKQGRSSKKIMGHRRTRTKVSIDAIKG
jgi:ribosomal protein L21